MNPPPGHSSLPGKPQWLNHPPTQQQQNFFQQSSYSSHYAQAYMQSQPTPPIFNNQNRPLPPQRQQAGTWYQPGSKRCTYNDCRFAGSPKAVELHMMDRHLIFPPGYDKRKEKEEWFADPSLKGKAIPIQGTNVILDSPETLEAWKEERRKRFPTANRVEDKKRKMDEAIARGQLTEVDMGVRPDKRRRTDDASSSRNAQAKGDRNSRGSAKRGRGGAAGGTPARGAAGHPPPAVHPLPPRPPPAQDTVAKQVDGEDDSGSSSDDDGAPEVAPSKVKVEPLPEVQEVPPKPPVAKAPPPPPPMRQRPAQPKRPLQNPFDNRPPLLRNLILPEIRMTVSNLSQAIRFLVDNDFLRDVELKPGQAQNALIQVISSSTSS